MLCVSPRNPGRYGGHVFEKTNHRLYIEPPMTDLTFRDPGRKEGLRGGQNLRPLFVAIRLNKPK
jgi:hypothetical protein